MSKDRSLLKKTSLLCVFSYTALILYRHIQPVISKVLVWLNPSTVTGRKDLLDLPKSMIFFFGLWCVDVQQLVLVEKTVKTASKITGSPLPEVTDVYTSRCKNCRPLQKQRRKLKMLTLIKKTQEPLKAQMSTSLEKSKTFYEVFYSFLKKIIWLLHYGWPNGPSVSLNYMLLLQRHWNKHLNVFCTVTLSRWMDNE